jgi:hypothetical protein
MAMLGHSDIRMTMQYGEQDLHRRRVIVEQMGANSLQSEQPLPRPFNDIQLFSKQLGFWPVCGR